MTPSKKRDQHRSKSRHEGTPGAHFPTGAQEKTKGADDGKTELATGSRKKCHEVTKAN